MIVVYVNYRLYTPVTRFDTDGENSFLQLAEICDSEKWKCFQCSPSEIYHIRAMYYAYYIWSTVRKPKLKLKEKEAKEKRKSGGARGRGKARAAAEVVEEQQPIIENFVDENIHEAFDTLKIYQKCLEVCFGNL